MNIYYYDGISRQAVLVSAYLSFPSIHYISCSSFPLLPLSFLSKFFTFFSDYPVFPFLFLTLALYLLHSLTSLHSLLTTSLHSFLYSRLPLIFLSFPLRIAFSSLLTTPSHSSYSLSSFLLLLPFLITYFISSLAPSFSLLSFPPSSLGTPALLYPPLLSSFSSYLYSRLTIFTRILSFLTNSVFPLMILPFP